MAVSPTHKTVEPVVTITRLDGAFGGTQDHHSRTQVDYDIDRATESRRVELQFFTRGATEWKNCKVIAS